jgi:hypothetical protein
MPETREDETEALRISPGSFRNPAMKIPNRGKYSRCQEENRKKPIWFKIFYLNSRLG